MWRVIAALLLLGATVIEPVGGATFEYPKLMTASPPLLIAFDARDGERRWRTNFDGNGNVMVVAADTNRLFGVLDRCMHFDRNVRSGDTSLVAFDAATGEVAWRRRNVALHPTISGQRGRYQPDLEQRDDWWFVDPAAVPRSDGVVPITSADGRVVAALDARHGRKRWTASLDGMHATAGTKNRVVLSSPADAEVSLRALDARTGRPRWTRTFPGFRTGRIAAGTDAVAVVAYSIDGSPTPWRVIVLDSRDGATRAEIPLSATETILAHAVATDDGVLVLFRVESSFRSALHTYAIGADLDRELWRSDGAFVDAVLTRSGPSVLGTLTEWGEPTPDLPPMARSTIGARDATRGATIWTKPSPRGLGGVTASSAVVVEAEEYDGSFTVVDRITSWAAEDGDCVWSIEPAPAPARPHPRRYRDVYTTGAFVGPDAVYLDGGCALTALN